MFTVFSCIIEKSRQATWPLVECSIPNWRGELDLQFGTQHSTNGSVEGFLPSYKGTYWYIMPNRGTIRFLTGTLSPQLPVKSARNSLNQRADLTGRWLYVQCRYYGLLRSVTGDAEFIMDPAFIIRKPIRIQDFFHETWFNGLCCTRESWFVPFNMIFSMF